MWEELKTVYIGRTINPKSRHYTHRHRETEKTYQFSVEHQVEHPKMVIIESGLTIEEGIQREKYWIDHYKEGGIYNVLNKTIGGQRGRQISFLTDEEKKQRRKEYYQTNKERIDAYNKKYRKEHIEEVRKRERKYSSKKYIKLNKPKKTKEEINEYRKKYKEEHKEELKLKRKEYYQNNKEKISSYRKQHQEEIKLKRREYFKKYYQEHKIKN